MRKLLRTVAIVVTGVSLAGGVAAANSGTIGTTGPDSTNSVEFSNSDTRRATNNTTGRVTNNNPQSAHTGRARVTGNTTGGDATSGDADNDSLLQTTATVNNTNANNQALNGGAPAEDTGTVNNTGPNSSNDLLFSETNDRAVENTTDVTVENNNEQHSRSGSAAVRNNTTGGNATSGGASNIGTSNSTLTVTN